MTTPKPLTAAEVEQWRAYLDTLGVPDTLETMSRRLLATLDAERAKGGERPIHAPSCMGFDAPDGPCAVTGWATPPPSSDVDAAWDVYSDPARWGERFDTLRDLLHDDPALCHGLPHPLDDEGHQRSDECDRLAAAIRAEAGTLDWLTLAFRKAELDWPERPELAYAGLRTAIRARLAGAAE